MTTISVRLEGFSALAASLGQQARQIPFAASQALNATARTVRTATLAEMAANFDRPTPLVMKSLFIAPATKAKLQASVYLKDREIGGKNIRSMAEILGHQFAGGTRLRKRMENAFTDAGLIGLGEYLRVPGARPGCQARPIRQPVARPDSADLRRAAPLPRPLPECHAKRAQPA